MRLLHRRLPIVVATLLLAATLAGCGDGGAAQNHSATPSPTINTKGAATPGPSPSPETLPYTFPSAWQNAAGPLAIEGPSGFAFAPSNQQIGYACASGPTPFNVTTDGGATWRGVTGAPFTNCASIFVDQQDPGDVFATQSVPYPANPAQSSDQLWRSRDGGATWQKLGAVTGTGFPLGWQNIAVVGSRLIGAVFVNGEGLLQNPIYYSDDGGMTWQNLAQSLANQGQGYTLDGFTAVNSTIYIEGAAGSSPAGLSAWPSARGRPTPRRAASQRVNLSGNPPSTEQFWRSTDGGNTWAPVWASLGLTSGLPTFVRAANGAGYYALAITGQASYDNGNVNDATLSWSDDGGVTWRKLPDIRGIEGDFVVGGGFESMIAPDGTVFAAGQHAQAGYGDDAGIFVIHPNSAAPAWSPLAPGGVQFWQATITATGARLWGVGSFSRDAVLKYVDVA